MEFTGITAKDPCGNTYIKWDDFDSYVAWVEALPEGRRLLGKFTRPRGLIDKTSPQLGYYYGLLLPEIHKQLVEDGFSVTKKFRKFEMEFPPSKEDIHGTLKCWVATMNHQEDVKDVGDMDINEMSKFIDGALQVAAQLNMNVEALEAKRPEGE